VDLTLSPQIKLVALIGLVAALALGGGMMFLLRSQSSTEASVPAAPLKHYHRHTTSSATAQVKPHHATHASTAPKPAVKPAAVKPRPAAQPAVASNGLPAALDMLLHTHRIVVVSLYDPEVPADAIAFAEARAGAADASAGFLGVNVLDERVSGPLTALAGNGTVLPDPGILVYRRPATLVNRITGFADRDAVAQLVSAALLAEPSASAAAPTPAPATTTPAAPAP
jgi:hypothetical protein